MTEIDCAHLKFECYKRVWKFQKMHISFQNELKLPSYPLYHSKYETFKAVDEFMDRGFKVSL